MRWTREQKGRRRKRKLKPIKHKKKLFFFLSYNIFSFTLCCLLNLTASLHKFYIKNLFLYFTLVCYNTREQAAAKTELESMWCEDFYIMIMYAKLLIIRHTKTLHNFWKFLPLLSRVGLSAKRKILVR